MGFDTSRLKISSPCKTRTYDEQLAGFELDETLRQRLYESQQSNLNAINAISRAHERQRGLSLIKWAFNEVRMDARLDTVIESWGGFRLTGQGSPVIYGRFRYSPESGVEVELVENPQNGIQLLQGNAPPVETLFGQLVDGTLVTLLGCVITNAAIQIGVGIGSPTKVVASRAIFGRHIADIDQLQIKSVAVELSSLSNWTGALPAQWEHVEEAGVAAGFDVTIRKPATIPVPLPQQLFDFEIAFRLNVNPSDTTFTAKWGAAVCLIAKQTLAFERINDHVWQGQNLIALLVGERLSVRAVTIVPADQQPPPPVTREEIAARAFERYSTRAPDAATADDDWREADRELRQRRAMQTPTPLQYVYQQVGKHDHTDVHPMRMLLPYGMIRDIFANITERWFARSEQAVLATNVFFGSQDFKSPAVNVRLLAVAQAAESYHRSLGAGLYMDQAAFDAAIQQVTNHIPAEIYGDHRNSLINRLRYGNGHSLRRRLTSMFERLPVNVRLRIAGNVNQFVHRFVETRNYYTHYDHTAQANAFAPYDAFVATERMRVLVVASLLSDLGIPNADLLTVLERQADFRHWMDTPINI